MVHLFSSSEFWAAVVGALLGALSGGVVTAMVGRYAISQQQRLSDLIAVQTMLDEFMVWLGDALFTPKEVHSSLGLGELPDEIERRVHPLVMRADSLFIRLGEDNLRTVFFSVHQQSSEFLRARSTHDQVLMYKLYQNILEGTRMVHSAAAQLIHISPFRSRWRLFWGEGVRVPKSMIVALQQVLSMQDTYVDLMMQGVIHAGNESTVKAARDAAVVMYHLETEYVIRAVNDLERQLGSNRTTSSGSDT